MKNRRNIIESELPPQNHLDIWMKDGKFYRSTNKGWVLIEDQMEFTNSELMSKSTATSGIIGVNKETGKASIYNDVTKEWSPLGGGLTETTWQKLKDKRDAGKLIPGALYRITDYQCTTTQENTRSAGHQFDIVLLALSANKLAEEGWAMEHPTDVYDVTFSDGVTKKCYIYIFNENGFETFYVIDTDTLLGVTSSAEEFSLNKNNKTATTSDYESIDLVIEGLNYNYFQNSNLSAWKVWYCLDNDKSKFAWADDSVGGKVISINTFYLRNKTADNGGYYGWSSPEKTIYTTSETPQIGDTVYKLGKGGLVSDGTVESIQTDGTGLPNGRGVIYRLIDEFNNDVPYDFKNIQYFVGNNWVYTLSKSESVGDSLPDASVVNDGFVVNNYISKQIDYMEGGEILAGNILIQSGHCSVIGVSKNNMVGGSKITLINCSDTRTMLSDSILISCSNLTPDESGFYFGNKKVLTEK